MSDNPWHNIDEIPPPRDGTRFSLRFQHGVETAGWFYGKPLFNHKGGTVVLRGEHNAISPYLHPTHWRKDG